MNEWLIRQCIKHELFSIFLFGSHTNVLYFKNDIWESELKKINEAILIYNTKYPFPLEFI